MREIYVSELVKDVLGPRNGSREQLSVKENPLNEYLTGILIPKMQDGEPEEEKESEDELIGNDAGNDEIEDTSDIGVGITSVTSPSLDPKRRPSSMGISFSIETLDPYYRVSISWGKYELKDSKGKLIYKRSPKVRVLNIPTSGSKKVKLSEDSNIYLKYHTEDDKNFSNRKRISLFLVNENEPKDRGKTEVENCAFQPQIRVKFGETTKLSKGGSKASDDPAESELSVLYAQRDFGVKGHLCSVILKEFDPQIIKPDQSKELSSIYINSPAFQWIDGISCEELNEDDKKIFAEPDIRTEFVPMYSVPGPEYDIKDNRGKSLNFYAKDLAELWKSEELSSVLSPMIESYEKWIDGNEQNIMGMSKKEQKVLSRLIDNSKISLLRMKKGLDLLLTNENARFAFCASNRAMELQYEWTKKKPGLRWRPFQMAYILLTIESIFNVKSDDRNICDLLWVATGGGKTEAYLAIIAFTIIIRRLNRLGGDSGYGTSVITRYTLRLLAIQQFRRTLTLVTALEYLRVLEYGEDKYGWRPAQYNPESKYVLGVTPFTIGLWVGSGVTPNKLMGNDYLIDTAISILKKLSDPNDSSEPAQVTSCPACDSILAIPSDGLPEGKHELFITVKSEFIKLQEGVSKCLGKYGKVSLKKLEAKQHFNEEYSTLEFGLEASDKLTIREINDFLNKVMNLLEKYDDSIEKVCSHLTRPGYFLRTYRNQKTRITEYNFEIYCSRPSCPLKKKWFGGLPSGMIHGREIEEFISDTGALFYDGMRLKDIINPFQDHSIYFSDRIPIPALTVDDQIYMNPPTILLATVDKFARPSFEPKAAAIFGNVDFHHPVYGYYREHLHLQGNSAHPTPSGGKTPIYVKVRKASPPNLILQDELHLIEGPLGGMVGVYETAIDYLIKEANGIIPKYIASTATIRNAEDQVKAVFARRVQLFPPLGTNSEDRFFTRESELHPLDEEHPGRLYVGIAAPGRGPLTPIYRIWARLLQTGWENRNNPEVNPFWTVTGYFNSIRELAGAVALYRQDIPQQLHAIGSGSPRVLREERKVELSSRTNSTELPFTLQQLNRDYSPTADNGAIDALFTTSMFGTGIDVSRLGLMVVNGQPKTTSAYIQSTGRIGRATGGLVITFLRASRPRDLSHYEYFCGFHRQLHRFVEPISAYPFAPKIMDKAFGPLSVFILRNTRDHTIPWAEDEYSGMMPQNRHSSQIVEKLSSIFEERSQAQPDRKRPLGAAVAGKVKEKIDAWEQGNKRSSGNHRRVRYVEYFKAECDVVLGDAMHKRSKNVQTIYDDAPQSLRDIEETTSFET